MSVATRKQEVIKLKDRGGENPPVTGTCSRELSAVTVVAVEGTSAVCASVDGPQEETLRTASFLYATTKVLAGREEGNASSSLVQRIYHGPQQRATGAFGKIKPAIDLLLTAGHERKI